jgi:hypothetical protein
MYDGTTRVKKGVQPDYSPQTAANDISRPLSIDSSNSVYLPSEAGIELDVRFSDPVPSHFRFNSYDMQHAPLLVECMEGMGVSEMYMDSSGDLSQKDEMQTPGSWDSCPEHPSTTGTHPAPATPSPRRTVSNFNRPSITSGPISLRSSHSPLPSRFRPLTHPRSNLLTLSHTPVVGTRLQHPHSPLHTSCVPEPQVWLLPALA